MSAFPRRSLDSAQHPLFKLAVAHIRRRPVVFFGLPFVGTLLGASVLLSRLTQTRYDYNATRVQTLAEEERLQLDHNRKRVDLREEYFRLSQPADVSGSVAPSLQYGTQEAQQETTSKKNRKPKNWDWDGEQIRVPRLPGMAEWGSVDPRDQSPEVGPRLV
ncbi:hypothetical protein CROQUDRAFT_657992 [Cronartium quercuum f. sp. fusiforme G11]|uniref:Cytochrome c oxidase assembly protein COX16, mitochondrial n=1 Tax=Cronartium quercuum f. sp. fusiforme G11 TaxID=708437 RepID=A0A9P6TB97_9BASI|nr:hypothetical protein CROQUDRAFT_657992 [Cronartium quercuum f. sp. fusiforme G11]